MAFTLEQKKQLTAMIDSPNEFLNACEKGYVYIPGFKNEFFKNGEGIFHLLVDTFINTENFEYVNVIKHLLKNESELSLFQSTGRKDCAFSLLLEGVKKDASLALVINEILSNESSIKNNSTSNLYLISSYAKELGRHGAVRELCELMELFPKLNSESSLCRSLLQSAIDKNNLELINFMLENESTKQTLDKNIGSYKFNTEKNYNNEKNVNLYAYCAIQNSDDILFKILDNYGDQINFDGSVKETNSYANRFPSDKTQHPIEIIINQKNKDLFDRYYSALPYNAKVAWLNMGNHRLNYIYEKSYEEVVLKDLSNIFDSSDVADVEKLKIFNQILLFSKWRSDDYRYQKILNIMEPLWEKVPPINGAHSFLGAKFLFNSFSSNGNMSNKEIDAFVNLFIKLKEIGHLEFCENMFSNAFFNEPVLVKNLLSAGLDISSQISYRTLDAPPTKFSFNVFEFFILLAEKHRQELACQRSNNLDLNRAKETLRIIYEWDKSLIFKETSKKVSLLELAIEHNTKEIFELLTVEDFKKFKELRGNEIISKIKSSYGPTEKYMETFTLCVDKLVKASFDFSQKAQRNYEQNPVYYFLFDKVSNFEILDKALLVSNADLEKDIQKFDFWLNLKTSNSLDFLKNKLYSKHFTIDPKCASEILLRLSFSDSYAISLENFLEIFPDLHSTKLHDKENILHNAIKNDAFQLAKMIATKYPDLAIDANKQNKMPASYMIVKFSKLLEKQSSMGWNRLKLDEHKELFDCLINCGLDSPNKTANRFLDEQLKKYSIIEETFPTIISEYRYQKLNRALKPANAPIKKKTKI